MYYTQISRQPGVHKINNSNIRRYARFGLGLCCASMLIYTHDATYYLAVASMATVGLLVSSLND